MLCPEGSEKGNLMSSIGNLAEKSFGMRVSEPSFGVVSGI